MVIKWTLLYFINLLTYEPLPYIVNFTPVLISYKNTLNFYDNNEFTNFVHKFYFEPTNDTVILKIISKLKSNAKPNGDDFNFNLIKLCCPDVVTYITHIIISCLNENTFPQKWKVVVMSNILKHCMKVQLSSYFLWCYWRYIIPTS